MLTFYEAFRRSAEPVLPPIYSKVRSKLLKVAEVSPDGPTVLDVGGRKSPYTINVPARVSIIDLPRSTEVQSRLNLGVNDMMIGQLKARRSNIERIILGDMTNSGLPSSAYDVVVSVEVLEHVEEDELFVSEVSRVLKPGGCFIMTTPNGDHVENRNPDHKRHYKRSQLQALLERHFHHVEVEYAIAGGYFRTLGLRPWSLRRPLWTMSSIVGNIVNAVQSNRKGIGERAIGTHHLMACAFKSERVDDADGSAPAEAQ